MILRFLLTFIAPLLLVSQTLRAAESPRQWVNREGRTIVATLITANDQRCTLRLADGKTSTLLIADLNEEGKKYIDAWLAGRRKDKAPIAPVTGPWPTSASAGENSRITEVKPDTASPIPAAGPGIHVYRSRHFELRSDVALLSGTVKEFADIFEATLAALQALPVGIDPVPPPSLYPVELYLDQDSYNRTGAPAGSGGFYSGITRKLVISLGNLGFSADDQRLRLDYRRSLYVLKHEAAHQVMGAFSGRLPVWLAEGWAEYIAAIPYDRGTYRFNNVTESTKNYINRWRKNEDQRRIPIHHPKHMMALSFNQWNRQLDPENAILNYNSAGLLVHYFLHFDEDCLSSNMAAYFNAVGTARNRIELKHRAREAEKEFFLHGRTHDQLAADLVAAWQKHGLILMIRKE